jgi:hypothetical protein
LLEVAEALQVTLLPTRLPHDPVCWFSGILLWCRQQWHNASKLHSAESTRALRFNSFENSKADYEMETCRHRRSMSLVGNQVKEFIVGQEFEVVAGV